VIAKFIYGKIPSRLSSEYYLFFTKCTANLKVKLTDLGGPQCEVGHNIS